MPFRTMLLGSVVAGLLCCHVVGAPDVERAAEPSLSFGVIADIQYADRDTVR